MSLLDQLGQGLKPDTTLTAKPVSITESYRQQLKVIAEGVDVNINNILNMMTVDQLNRLISIHKKFAWENPESIYYMILDGISKTGEIWMLNFSCPGSSIHSASHPVHDLHMNDLLQFMSTCENVLVP